MVKRAKPEMVIGEVRTGLKCDCGNDTFEWVKFLNRPYRQCTTCYKLHDIQELLIKEDTGEASPNGEPLSSPQQAEGYPAEGK